MSLTLGHGPLSARPTGETNYRIDAPAHRLLLEEHPRRMRARLGGRTVLDTRGGRLLHESGIPPVLYVPFEHIDAELLERTDHFTHCPFKGDASYWSLHAGDRTAENAVWAYEDPTESASWLRGFASIAWGAVDGWLEEEDPVIGHLRDPYHRVDVLQGAQHVRVEIDGEVIAETDRPKLLFETGLPVRYYVPPQDVRLDLLEGTPTATICPYKGTAAYLGLRDAQDDLAWRYPSPLAEAAAVCDHVAFLDDRVTLTVSGSEVGSAVPA